MNNPEQTNEQRSKNMQSIRGKNTSPEIKVRSVLHHHGFRFRLHRKDLPGKPDLVFPKYNIALFVHGCFWHQHYKCKRSHKPKTNTQYWDKKLAKNVERDFKNREELLNLGWNVLIIWECEIFDEKNILDKFLHFIESTNAK